MMRLQQAFDWIKQRIPEARLVGDGALILHRVHTDTRSLQENDFFVALAGERFDAHDFLPQLHAQGVHAALAQQGLAKAGLSGIEVPDSKLAMGTLAAAWRAQFSLPLIAVTGSNGKTTVTQMLASILRSYQGEHAFYTQGNFNNDIGVPLTLLRLRESHRIGVVELGMNHPGEIAYLADITKPTVALVNNAQREHLEFMQTIEAVAYENGSVLTALPSDGVAVFPADDDYTHVWHKLKTTRRVRTFALTQADVTATKTLWAAGAWQVQAKTPLGNIAFSLKIAGVHNVKNALAATACALAAGVPLQAIAEGLNHFEPVKGRSRALSIRLNERDVSVIDDTYNANPDSMHAAIDVLAALPAPRLLVIGDMGEVGDQGLKFHTEAMDYAHSQNIDTLLCMGDLCAQAAVMQKNAQYFSDIATLLSAVQIALPEAASVLVKGSRFMKMERVVDAIVAASQPNLEQK